MTEQWLLTPPLPGERLVWETVTMSGLPVQVAVHEELLGEIRHLVPLLESAACT